jgi:hypothetical protein
MFVGLLVCWFVGLLVCGFAALCALINTAKNVAYPVRAYGTVRCTDEVLCMLRYRTVPYGTIPYGTGTGTVPVW